MILPVSSSGARALARAALLLAGVHSLPAQSAAPAPTPPLPPIELPAVTVTGQLELPHPESWEYAQIEGFEVLSNAPSGATRRLLRDFSLFREALAVMRPAATGPQIPSTIILCGRDRQFDGIVPGGTDRDPALARLRLAGAKRVPEEDGRLSAAQLAGVLAPLLRARTLSPALAATYEVMAEAWACSAVVPTPANVHVVGEGAMKFPFNTDLSWHTAQLYLLAGDRESAAGVARMGLRFAGDEPTRARFEEFLAGLAAPSPEVPVSAP